MHKPRSAHTAFNPEKFLAADAKKKAGTASARRVIPLFRVIALADTFKKALYVQLEKERPELFSDPSALLKANEYADVLGEFFRCSLANQKLKLSDDIVRVLYLDFIRGLMMRSFKNRARDASNSENGEKA